jgi:hypothetical protein
MEPPKNVLKQNWNEREGKWYLMKRAPKIWRCPFSPIKSAYVTLLGHHKCAFFLPFLVRTFGSIRAPSGAHLYR